MKDSVIHMMEETIADYVNQCASEDAAPEEWDMDTLNAELRPIIPFGKIELTQEEIQAGKPEMLTKRLQDEAVELYAHKETEFEDYDLREIERSFSSRSLTASGWIISTIWTSFGRVSACRHTDREIR